MQLFVKDMASYHIFNVLTLQKQLLQYKCKIYEAGHKYTDRLMLKRLFIGLINCNMWFLPSWNTNDETKGFRSTVRLDSTRKRSEGQKTIGYGERVMHVNTWMVYRQINQILSTENGRDEVDKLVWNVSVWTSDIRWSNNVVSQSEITSSNLEEGGKNTRAVSVFWRPNQQLHQLFFLHLEIYELKPYLVLS